MTNVTICYTVKGRIYAWAEEWAVAIRGPPQFCHYNKSQQWKISSYNLNRNEKEKKKLKVISYASDGRGDRLIVEWNLECLKKTRLFQSVVTDDIIRKKIIVIIFLTFPNYFKATYESIRIKLNEWQRVHFSRTSKTLRVYCNRTDSRESRRIFRAISRHSASHAPVNSFMIK